VAGFRFRLAASLSLAEQALTEAERQLARELAGEIALQRLREDHARLWQEALAGQRAAGKASPQDLGRWQAYARSRFAELQRTEQSLQAQQGKVAAARAAAARAYREAEKLRRLKSRQQAAFLMAEQRREQKILDEAGQVGFWQQRNGAAP